MTMQHELAVEGSGLCNAFGKHCMNEQSGLGVPEGKLMTSEEIPPGSAYKGMLSVR